MSNLVYVSALAAVLCLFSAGVQAQNEPAPATPVGCAQATSLQVNGSEISGFWYEVARNPAPSSYVGCVEVSMALEQSDNNTLGINTTFATDSNSLYMNKTTSITVLLNGTDYANGYSAQYGFLGQNEKNTTFKLLATDYNNYAFICGYTNATDNSTEFGVILTRNRIVQWSTLSGYEALASQNFSNFLNGSMANITQSEFCYTSGAATTLPILSALMALIYVLFQQIF